MKRITRSRDWDEAKLCWGRLDTIENILGDEYDLNCTGKDERER